jgi:hypothetical protein
MMLAFALIRQPLTASQRKGDPIPFSFPKSFYLDRFLFGNLELANRKRSEEEQISWEMQDLQTQRDTLTRFEVRAAVRFSPSADYNSTQSKGIPFRTFGIQYTTMRRLRTQEVTRFSSKPWTTPPVS